MSPEEQVVAAISGHSPLKDFPPDVLMIQLNPVLIRACLSMGQQSPNESFMAVLVSDLADILKDKFSSLTFHEVELALKWGVKGQFGSYYNPNLNNFWNWLISYRNCDARKSALEKIKRQAEKPAFKGRERLMRGLTDLGYARLVFLAYKRGECLENYSPVIVYEILTEQKIMSVTDEEWGDALNRFKNPCILGVQLMGEAAFGIRHACAKRFLLELQFDRWIEEQMCEQEMEPDFAA